MSLFVPKHPLEMQNWVWFTDDFLIFLQRIGWKTSLRFRLFFGKLSGRWTIDQRFILSSGGRCGMLFEAWQNLHNRGILRHASFVERCMESVDHMHLHIVVGLTLFGLGWWMCEWTLSASSVRHWLRLTQEDRLAWQNTKAWRLVRGSNIC